MLWMHGFIHCLERKTVRKTLRNVFTKLRKNSNDQGNHSTLRHSGRQFIDLIATEEDEGQHDDDDQAAHKISNIELHCWEDPFSVFQ